MREDKFSLWNITENREQSCEVLRTQTLVVRQKHWIDRLSQFCSFPLSLKYFLRKYSWQKTLTVSLVTNSFVFAIVVKRKTRNWISFTKSSPLISLKAFLVIIFHRIFNATDSDTFKSSALWLNVESVSSPFHYLYGKVIEAETQRNLTFIMECHLGTETIKQFLWCQMKHLLCTMDDK